MTLTMNHKQCVDNRLACPFIHKINKVNMTLKIKKTLFQEQ